MNKAKTLEEDVNMGLRIWGDADEPHSVNRPKENQVCNSCNLVKWYPPLLTMSTIMAGVFCWLYVTKPVLVTKTVMPSVEAPSTQLVASAPDLNGDVVVRAVSAMPTLSPDVGFLPGEKLLGQAQLEPPVPGQDVEAVRVQRSARSLFQPLKAEGLGDLEVLAVESDIPEERDAIVSGGLSFNDGLGEEEVLEEDSEPFDDVGDSSPELYPREASLEEDFRPTMASRKVAISLMGELISVDKHNEAVIAASIDEEGLN